MNNRLSAFPKTVLAQEVEEKVSRKGEVILAAQAVYNFVLHGSKSSYTTKEISDGSGVPYLKTSNKLHSLKYSRWVKKNEDNTWSIGLK